MYSPHRKLICTPLFLKSVTLRLKDHPFSGLSSKTVACSFQLNIFYKSTEEDDEFFHSLEYQLLSGYSLRADFPLKYSSR